MGMLVDPSMFGETPKQFQDRMLKTLKEENDKFINTEIFEPVTDVDHDIVFDVIPDLTIEMLKTSSFCITDLHTGYDHEFEYSFGIIERNGELWIYSWGPLEKDDKSRGNNYISGCKVENMDQVVKFLSHVIDVDPNEEDSQGGPWQLCRRAPLTQEMIDERIYTGPYPNSLFASMAGLTKNYS